MAVTSQQLHGYSQDEEHCFTWICPYTSERVNIDFCSW